MAHILLVEDYRDNREVVELILRAAGYTVTSASTGLHGVQLATRDQPDLIVMDLALPVLNGWEATRSLKANPATAHIPVIAFTAHVTHEDLAHAFAVGCVAVISKPFELASLLTMVAAVLAHDSRMGQQRTVGTGLEE
jgi:two-component system, cell cycle response regulator DivK